MNFVFRERLALFLVISLLLMSGSAQVASQSATDEVAEENLEVWVAPLGEEVSRDFHAILEEVREALLAVLEKAGIPLEEKEMVTAWTSIDPETLGLDVAEPPPRFSATYPIPHRRNVVFNGNYRLLVRIVPGEDGSRVGLVAEIYEVLAIVVGRARVQRTSNGTIEKFFLDRLEQRLSPPKAQPKPED